MSRIRNSHAKRVRSLPARATLALAWLTAACGGTTPDVDRNPSPAAAGSGAVQAFAGIASSAGGLGGGGAGSPISSLNAGAAVGGSAGSAGIDTLHAGSGGTSATAGTTGSAGTTSTSAGTTAGAGGATSPTTCPAPPADAPANAVAALNATNALRIASGSGCATFVQTIADGATKHCEYYAANAATAMCIADPHAEVMSCMGFTGASFSTRIRATGYTGSPAFEVMAFLNNPTKAVTTWVNSVWHRIPMLSPWVTELGYGAATACDTIDFGRGKPLPDTTIVVYPYDTETDIPIAFDGSREGPMPPTPSTGKWPSGPPISLYGKKLSITDHVLTKDGDTTPIVHTWLDAATADAMFKGFLTDIVFMYPDSPLTAATKYRVHIKGTSTAGALDREWTFTTH